ncbi:MAG: M15 family metallopeptidase [Lachnospiraceae bacterium]|nr:M15 family metallopeptidase [Lachnospiraceae bacterium]
MRTDEEAKGDFYVSEISDEIFAKMQGKSFKADCKTARSDLRYVHVLHKDISGVTHEGELVVNKKIAKDVLEIFEELYNNSYPIEKVRLIDEYNADDELSMRDNNSAAFNYRTIAGTNRISKHGSGMAVDINTLYNPYVKIRDDGSAFIQPETAGAYTNRNADFPYKIESGDLCCRLFKEHGFEWGGDWTSCKDYQHFEK